MNNITNEKVRALVPKWETFPGFSLLFDNPGKENYLRNGGGISKINCDPENKEVRFYKKIDQVRRQLLPSLPSNDYLLCELPLSSFHVTVWDGANAGNINEFSAKSKVAFERLFANYPASLVEKEAPFNQIHRSGLILKDDWRLKLKFGSLAGWSNNVLVILLEPADDNSILVLDEIRELRRELNQTFQQEHGFSRSFRDTYLPHISIGYFANTEYGEKFKPRLEEWNHSFRESLQDIDSEENSVTFDSISIYGFTDMITFFKQNYRTST